MRIGPVACGGRPRDCRDGEAERPKSVRGEPSGL